MMKTTNRVVHRLPFAPVSGTVDDQEIKTKVPDTFVCLFLDTQELAGSIHMILEISFVR